LRLKRKFKKLLKIFKKLLSSGTISFYGYSGYNLPKEIVKYSEEKIDIFFKNNNQKIDLNNQYKWHYYSGYKDTPWDSKDIVFFDQDAIKSVCVGFPTKSKYVAVSLKYPKYYIFIILGLLRRFKLKSIEVKGLYWVNNTPWLIIKCKEIPTNSLSINSELGISGFLKFLREGNVKYLVPRFYENLPNLITPDADLDIIVDIKSVEYVKQFLIDNPGDIPIDLYTDYGTDYHGMSYVPPKKAKEAIENAIDGPGGSKVPSKIDSLNLMIYHVLYHKGYLSIVNFKKNITNNYDLKNKYKVVIDSLKYEIGVEIGDTLEEMDDYMDQVGWKPALDTLSKISQWNEWVRDYHMASKEINYVPLYVLILKEGIIGTEGEKLINYKCKEEGIHILEERILKDDIKEKAISDLRGGIWNDSLKDINEVYNFYPSKILVVWDTRNRGINGITKFKNKLRKTIDSQETSYVHSSDNYNESLDYIEICLPDKLNFYNDKNLLLEKYGSFLISEKKSKERILDILSRIKMNSRNLILKIMSH
jgi:hypothetical protein